MGYNESMNTNRLNLFLWAALGLVLCGSFFGPLWPSSVLLRADFTSATHDGAYATFRGNVTLEGHRSLWSKLAHPALAATQAPIALRLGVSQAIAQAGGFELAGQPELLSRWGRTLESACSDAMSDAIGGLWTGSVEKGFELIPSDG